MFIEIEGEGIIMHEGEGKDHYAAIKDVINQTFKKHPKANIRVNNYEEIKSSPELIDKAPKGHNYHVEPVNDTHPHSTGGMDCSCNPKLEKQPNGAWIIIHNAWDKRENREQGIKPS